MKKALIALFLVSTFTSQLSAEALAPTPPSARPLPATFKEFASAPFSALSATPGWSATGEDNTSNLGTAFAAGDINGDGCADLAVGAPGYNSNEGRVYVYYGSGAGQCQPLSPLTLDVPVGSTSPRFGSSIAVADVNGNGYADVIIGAPGQAKTEQGKVYIYLGSASGLSPSYQRVLAGSPGTGFGASVASAGDVNGDGYTDIVIGEPLQYTDIGCAYVYSGSSSGIGATAAITLDGAGNIQYGQWVSPAGDVNGDGYADVIVGAPGNNKAYVYLGNPSTGLNVSGAITLTGSGQFGQSAAAAGDVNGDGYADVIIGAPGSNQAYIYLGNASTGLSATPILTLTGSGQFGQSVGSAGDVNGDGYADAMVGAPANGQGQAYVYLGGGAGLSATAVLTLTAESSGQSFGQTVGSAGDMNGDGYADIFVGDNTYEVLLAQSQGRAYAYYGGAYLPQASPNRTITGAGNLGRAVATAGDVNGDGYADVVIGAPGNNQAYIYLGNSSPGLGAAAAITLTGSGQFGQSVGSAGDMNGDGYADVIVGAPGANKAYVYPGGSALSNTPILTLTGQNSTDNFGAAVGPAGDVNGDGYADVIVGAPGANQAYIYLGGSTLSAAPALTRAGINGAKNFGRAVGTAGDVNGDGYADFLVGADGDSSTPGQAFLYLGAPSNTGAAPALTLPGQSVGDHFGAAVGALGDVNGDGYADFMVGAYGANFARVYLGNASVGAITSATLNGANNFGRSVGAAGDVNGDGYADAIIGADGYNSNQGCAYLYLGAASGLGASPALTLTVAGANAYFGASAGAAGDINGDGYADLVVGAYGASRAYIYPGNTGGGRGGLAGSRRVSGSLPVPPWSFSQLADGFQLRLTAADARGRSRVKMQTQICPAGVPFFTPASCLEQISPAWADVTAAGAGVTLAQTLTGLASKTLYRWRTRVLYAPYTVTAAGITAPPNPPHGPWRRFLAQSQEADLRTSYVDLRLAKQVIPTDAYPGQPITYTLTFSNAGNGFAYGILITDTMPSNVTNASFSTSGVALTQVGANYAWSSPSLAAGEGGLITITGQISPDLVAGLITNNAIITTATSGANTDQSRGSARTVVNLRLVYLPLMKR